jgi:hypothetical protein
MAKRLSVGVPPTNSYPHPPFPDAVLRAVVSAIRRAWMPIAEDERKRGTEKVTREKERHLNNELRKELFALILLWRTQDASAPDMFEMPVVDGAMEDYLGKRLQSSPDLTIRLRDVRPLAANPLFDAIFIECKRVREGSNLGPYTKGMKRFLDGQYAWAVPQAVMIGYLETGQVLPDHLEERIRRNGDGMQVVAYSNNQAVRSSGKRYLAYTRHERTWTHRNGDAPGNIELLHLWLSRFD